MDEKLAVEEIRTMVDKLKEHFAEVSYTHTASDIWKLQIDGHGILETEGAARFAERLYDFHGGVEIYRYGIEEAAARAFKGMK